MGSRIDWVIGSCGLLAQIGEEFDSTRPFAGRRIGTGIHLRAQDSRLAPDLAPRRGRGDLDRESREHAA